MAGTTNSAFPGRAKDITGTVYGRLTVIGRAGHDAGHRPLWLAQCECGGQITDRSYNLARNVSCGCHRSSRAGRLTFKHGHFTHRRRTATYYTWQAMIARCENPNKDSYRYYGARGVRVCERWRSSFVAFLADMGDRPAGKTIDRIQADGNYEPGNCRWATPTEQRANQR